MFGLAERSSPTFRRLLIGLVVFGVVVVLDLLLFGWLIFRSLSQREIERVLLETRAEAEDIAGRIAERANQGTDLYTVIAVERETRTYIADVLRQRGLVSEITVYDKDGVLVYRQNSEEDRPVPGKPLLPQGPSEIPGEGGLMRTEEDETRHEYHVDEPIGDFGTLRIGIDEKDLQERIGDLRHELLGQAGILGVVTTVLLVGSFLLIAALLRRGHKLEEQAAESERMAYIGTLASGLAHEIRNPLNSLNLNMQMLEEELDGRGEVSTGGRLLGITRREIARLERLVTDFLSYARPRPLEIEEGPAGDLLEQARELLAGEARARRAELSAVDHTGGAVLQVDPGQMRQLVLNLAQNALTAAAEHAAEPRVVLAAAQRGSMVELRVEDNGPGIPPEARERVFDIFYSTRKGGTGLGLAIVARIARNHGGRVEIDSEPGEGTTVRVLLPPATETPPSSGQKPKPKTLRVTRRRPTTPADGPAS